MKNISLTLAIPIFSLLCIATALNAQAPQQEPKFALEVQSGEGSKPSYALVPLEQDSTLESLFFSGALISLPAESAESSPQEKPSALGLHVKAEGDSISIVASLYFGALNFQSEDLAEHPHQLLGNYSLRLNEIVVLEEMKKFGFQPYTIKVVMAQAPLSGTPVLSEVPSLQIAIAGENRTTYKLVVHNLSPQAVKGMVIERDSENQRNGLTGYDDAKPLIAPGEHYNLSMDRNNLDCASPNNSINKPVPCPIVLRGALFADGTHAGDPAVVAGLELARLKTSAPLQQLRELLRNTVYDPTLSDAEKIARLRSEIPKLSEKSDPATDQLRSRYPELSDEEWKRIEAQNNSVRSEKQTVLQRLDRYEESSPASLSVDSLAQWLRRYGMVD